MDIDELKAELDLLFHPEPNEDGEYPSRDIPHPRLEKEHQLDLSYLRTYDWEGSSLHPCSRTCPADEHRLYPLIRNLDVPSRLFESGLLLFSESIVAYHSQSKRKGPLHYYPPVILTLWTGFEAFVRHASELMLTTVCNVPPEVENFLRDQTSFVDVDKKGEIRTKKRYQSVLDRYVVMLRYGHEYHVNRGSRYWQRLDEARRLRDYYTHVNISESRSISSEQVIHFIESVILAIIWPSAEIGRTQLLGIYNLYWIWDSLRKLAEPYTEEPFFKDWPMHGPYLIYCPFKNVDVARFPNSFEKTGA